MKNKFLIVVLIIIMLVPSVVGIINYAKNQGGAADSHNTVSLELTDVAGGTYNFVRANGNVEQIDFFLSMMSNAEAIGSVPSTIELGDFYIATVQTTVNTFSYKFYFTTDAEDCYYVDNNGNSYKIATADAQAFLEGPYSASLYENGAIPVLTVSGTKVVPDSSKWFFTNIKGEITEADTSGNVKEEKESVKLEGGLAMTFTSEPDSFAVTVKDMSNGETLFDDVYANIANLLVTESMNVEISVNAKWYEESTRNYYGEQSYVFNATVSAPATFYAGATEIQIGEFISVTGLNVGNIDDITFTSEPSINYSPIFFQDGEYVRTLVPFANNLTAGDYVLTFAYGGSSQQINIKLLNRDNPFGSRTVTIADTIVASNGSADAIAKAKEDLSAVAKSTEKSSTKYFDDKEFLTGLDNSTIVGGYGHTFEVAGTDMSYEHTGVDYAAAAGTSVQAINNGVVVYAGYLDYNGYTVVVEHGFGLKSWYCHMSANSVNVGDTVNKGDTLGTAGSTGFTSTTGAHVGLTVFDVPVCQYALWSDGARKGVPMYTK